MTSDSNIKNMKGLAMNKKLLFGLLGVVVMAVASLLVYPKFFPSKPERKVLYWTDPMIPGDRSDHPGKSPMGMERKPVYADDQAQQVSSSPGDTESYYTCPMHPWVRSNKPGPCPVCGMAMVKKTTSKEMSPEDLASLQRVSLSPAQRVMANVATTTVGRADIDREINAVGVVDIAEPLQAKVTARFNGRIEKLYIGYSGAVVKKGDPLFELHSPDLVSAEQELILAVSALQKNPVPGNEQQKLLDAARERLHIHFGMSHEQIAQIEQQETAHETMDFLSPISGTVISKEIQEGDYVNEGTLLYQLADLSRVWIYLDVYEQDVADIRLGHSVRITADSYPDEVFTGKVTFIDPVINSETRTVRVRTEFENPAGKLKPGMYVQAEIHVPSRHVLSIPSTAVLFTGKRNIVWVEISNNVFEPRDVALGTSSGSSVEVLSGIRAGESIVTSGSFLIESESQLEQPAGETSPANHLPRQPRDQRANSSRDHMPAIDRQPKSEDAQTVVIAVSDEGYSPDIIHAVKGKKLSLTFDRQSESECTEEVVLRDFNIRKKLPAHGKTSIEINPQKAGEYSFVCGQNMLEGKIVVQ